MKKRSVASFLTVIIMSTRYCALLFFITLLINVSDGLFAMDQTPRVKRPLNSRRSPIKSLSMLALKCIIRSTSTMKLPPDLSAQTLKSLSNRFALCSPQLKKLLFNQIIDAADGNATAYKTFQRVFLAALIHASLNPDTIHDCNGTFLHDAALHNDSQAITLLFEYGANANIIGGPCNSVPIQHVKTTTMAQLFFDHGQNMTSFVTFFNHLAKDDYHPDLIPFYIQHGADITIQDEDNYTLLHYLVLRLALDREIPINLGALLIKARHLLNRAPALLTMPNSNGVSPRQLLKMHLNANPADTQGLWLLACLDEYAVKARAQKQDNTEHPAQAIQPQSSTIFCNLF